MNDFGRLFKISVFGESHGPYVGVVIDGCPAGLVLAEEDFSADMERRRGGLQKGTTTRREDDRPLFISGIFQGKTTGTPLTILFSNQDSRPADYDRLRSVPRPGHADFVARSKFGGYEDYRGGGHFSGRLTVGIVAAGVVAKKILSHISIKARLVEIAGEQDLEAGLQKAIEAKDTVGGIVECVVSSLPVGLGEPFFDSVESLLAHFVFSIPAVKGIEFGAGFHAARMFGSEHNDSILDMQGTTETNHAGGVVGGITNGNELIFRVAVKPTSSTPQKQTSLNWETGESEEFTVKGRHDLCIALRVPPVLEAAAAIVVADLMLLEQRVSRVL